MFTNFYKSYDLEELNTFLSDNKDTVEYIDLKVNNNSYILIYKIIK